MGGILVVDDQEPNRLLLTEILQHEKYRVTIARSGAEALEFVEQVNPDLVLLDVSMPDMDGFEVCRRLRRNPAHESLPIILVTALGHREHRLEGIAAGANDYLTKPIDRPDLLLRVRNTLNLRRLHREMADQYDKLLRTERLRDNLVHMLVHDLRSPLTSIMAYLEIVRMTLEQRGEEAVVADLDQVTDSAKILVRMVSNVLDVSRLEADAMPLQREQHDLVALTSDAIGTLSLVSQETPVEFERPSTGVMVQVDPSLLRRVIGNLIDNAIKFTPAGGIVRVRVLQGATGPEVRVTDSGPGVPLQYHRQIFEKFGTVTGSRIPGVASSGLGLTFCKLVVEAHQGTIGLQSVPGEGSTFWFTLPATT